MAVISLLDVKRKLNLEGRPWQNAKLFLYVASLKAWKNVGELEQAAQLVVLLSGVSFAKLLTGFLQRRVLDVSLKLVDLVAARSDEEEREWYETELFYKRVESVWLNAPALIRQAPPRLAGAFVAMYITPARKDTFESAWKEHMQLMAKLAKTYNMMYKSQSLPQFDTLTCSQCGSVGGATTPLKRCSHRFCESCMRNMRVLRGGTICCAMCYKKP